MRWPEIRTAVGAVAVLVAAASTAGCGVSGEEEAKRGAIAQARTSQESLVAALTTNTLGAAGQGQQLADNVRTFYESDAWFGEPAERDGRGVLTAYFDGMAEATDWGAYDRSQAHLCVRLAMELVDGRLQVDSTDIACPEEILGTDETNTREFANTFQQFGEDGDAQWVTLDELSRAGH